MGDFEFFCLVMACISVFSMFFFSNRPGLGGAFFAATVIWIILGATTAVRNDNDQIREKRAVCTERGLVYLPDADVCVEGFRP